MSGDATGDATGDLPGDAPADATPAIRLRPPRDDDHPQLLAWRRDPETDRLLMFRSAVDSLDGVREWVARRSSDPDGVFELITLASDDRPIGFVQLTRIDRSRRSASLGLFVEPAARGLGVAARALGCMEQRAACRHDVRRLAIEVLASNERALRFWRRQGYLDVGTLPRHFAHGGALHDVVLLEREIGS